MVLIIKKWDGNWLRRAQFGGLWALSQECCCNLCGCPGLVPEPLAVTIYTSEDCLGLPNGYEFVLDYTNPDPTPPEGDAIWSGNFPGDICLYGSLSISCRRNPDKIYDWEDYWLEGGLTVSGCKTTLLFNRPNSGDCDTLNNGVNFYIRFDDVIKIEEFSPGSCPCDCENYPVYLTLLFRVN
jgi:hypothetical protein